MGISVVGWTVLILVTFFLPFLAIKSARRVKAQKIEISGQQYFVSAVTNQAIMALVCFATIKAEHLALFPTPRFGALDLWLSLGFLAITLGTLPMRWNWRSPEGKRKALRRLPKAPREVAAWVFVSLLAGTIEEVLFRGVLYQLWWWITGSVVAAVAICSISFAVSHIYQGWRSVAVIVPMAVASHAIVIATGSLYTMMIIHFVYDVLAGLTMAELARRQGYVETLETRPS